MPDPSLEYVKKLLKIADGIDDANGKADGVISKTNALAYLDALIKEATSKGCVQEVEHLAAVRVVTASLNKEQIEVPWGNWKSFIVDPALKKQIKYSCYDGPIDTSQKSCVEGLLVLDWYKTHPEDVGCSSINYQAVADKIRKDRAR